MTTALVIAGTSFVGRHLIELLRQQNVKVVATSRRADPHGRLVVCDVRDRQNVFEVVRGVQPDWVFNCAAETAWPVSALECYRTHVIGTLHLLQAIRTNVQTARTVLFGSAAEYGSVPGSALPIVETQPVEPLSIFGTSKLAQTELARQAATEWNLRLVLVRPFNILGPGQGEQYLASQLIQRLRNEHNPDTPLGIVNGACTRDFVDVRDVCDAVVGLIDAACPGEAQIYNIASGVEVSIRALAEHLSRIAGGPPVVDRGVAESRTHVQRSCGDAAKLRQTTGWRPQITWQRSLIDMWSAVSLPELRKVA